MLAAFVKALQAFVMAGTPVLGGSLDSLNTMSTNNYSSGM